MSFNLRDMIISLPGLLVALSFHEYAHALVADNLGDDTPRLQGRLTVNPLAHIDWLGFLMLLVAHFGWAKPVMVNPLGFRRAGMKKGMMMVSLAGPAMNFLLAFVAALVMRFMRIWLDGQSLAIAFQLMVPLLWYNVILGIFNLIPVPPLDGSKILAGLLPDRQAAFIYSMERYGPIILLLLIFSGAVGWLLNPPVEGLVRILEILITA